MRGDTEQDELMIGYLLGQLPDEEMTRVEERFLADGDYFDRLLALEDALVDEYVRNEMPAAQRKDFEGLVKSSQLQHGEVEFTRGLLSDLERKASLEKIRRIRHMPPPASRSRVLLTAIGLVSIIAIALAAWALHTRQELKRAQTDRQSLEDGQKQAQLHAEEQANKLSQDLAAERERNEKLQVELAELKGPPGGEIASISLIPASITRGGSRMSVLNVGPQVRQIRIQLGLTDADRYPSYGVTIMSDDQRTIWSKTGIPRQGRSSLSVTVPAERLPTGDYVIALAGRTDSNGYSEIRQYVFGVRKTARKE